MQHYKGMHLPADCCHMKQRARRHKEPYHEGKRDGCLKGQCLGSVTDGIGRQADLVQEAQPSATWEALLSFEISKIRSML